MKTLIIQRLAHFSYRKKPVSHIRADEYERGISGVLIDPKSYVPLMLTMELPWVHNEPNISCIPAGMYICERTNSPKYGETFEVKDVLGRTYILFHWGNFNDNTKGCILLGEQFDFLNGEFAILTSKGAFKQFMDTLEGVDEFRLDLRRPCVNPMYP